MSGQKSFFVGKIFLRIKNKRISNIDCDITYYTSHLNSGPNEFAEFYERLKGIKDFHRRHPGESISIPMSVEFEELKKAREGNDDTGGHM